MSIFIEKKRCRQQVLAARRALSEAQRQQYSQQICERVFQYLQTDASLTNKRPITILSYMALFDEVDVRAIFAWCSRVGHRLLIPRVLDEKQGILSLHEVDENTEFEVNRYGIQEPLNASYPEEMWSTIDVAIIPGVAYDQKGVRLGFGGGFYDRLVARLQNALLIAPAFSCQVLGEVPNSEHDLVVHTLVTEQTVVKCRVSR